MLHELLLALIGFTGDIIIDEREHQKSLGINLSPDDPISDKCCFRLAPDTCFIESSDRDIIQRLVALGFYYRELDRFATQSRNLSWISSEYVSPLAQVAELSNGISKPSVYRRAIANGIIEVLSVYRSAILLTEQNLLAETVPLLASVTHGLNKFFILLPPLYELVMEIERDDIRGGKLLNFLHIRCHCGVPELQACIQRLLWHGHQVMYGQLASWMIYGVLQDQHDEFFIRRHEDVDSDVLQKLGCLSISDAPLTDWHLGFHIVVDMLPEYIHMNVAESILFAGKAVRILRNSVQTFQLKERAFDHQLQRGIQKSEGFMGSFLLSEPFACNKLVGEELFPHSEADKIDALLQDLKQSCEFHKRKFECAIDAIRAIAATHLWQLVMIHSDLNGHLKALKDYFLLAKGDFFQCFLEESRQLMCLPPRQSSAEADLMVPFQLAAAKTIGDEDKYFSRVSLRLICSGRALQANLPRTSTGPDGISGAAVFNLSSEMPLDGWNGISLEYSTDWLLQLFFTQDVLSKYVRVFQYLLKLKRTQMELEKSWAAVMHQAHVHFSQHQNSHAMGSLSPQRLPMWCIREHMAFLIRNLHFYIQVDVIESQWNILQSHIQGSRDFTELVSFHQEYLSALISQSFLDIGSVSRILDSIMQLCLQFCWGIEDNQRNNCNSHELEQIIEEFHKKSNSLYTILRSSRLAGSQRAPYLRRFLLRLNFNSFFEATARGIMRVSR